MTLEVDSTTALDGSASADFDQIFRLHPRTFPYQELLPYKTETKEDTLAHLDHIVTNIYIVLESLDKDHAVASTVNSTILHWTRELNSWMQLKFDLPLATRVKLARLYYELALADVEGTTLEKIVNTFVWLCDDEAFLRHVKPSDIKLRAKPLVQAIKDKVMPGESNPLKLSLPKSLTVLCRMAGMARSFFDYNETQYIYQEILPIVCQFTAPPRTFLTLFRLKTFKSTRQSLYFCSAHSRHSCLRRRRFQTSRPPIKPTSPPSSTSGSLSRARFTTMCAPSSL